MGVDLYTEIPQMAIFNYKMGSRLIHGKIQYMILEWKLHSTKPHFLSY